MRLDGDFYHDDPVKGPHGTGIVDTTLSIGLFGPSCISQTPWFRTGWVPVRMDKGHDTYYSPRELIRLPQEKAST